MEPRLNFFKANPEAMQAMAGIEQHIARSGLEEPLMELVRLRTSQINGCDLERSESCPSSEKLA